MALIALLFAHHGVGPEGEPPAALRVAGVTVIERQVRLVRRGGASRVLVVVERMPPGLAAALQRADVEIVRASTAFAIGEDDAVLVIADSLLVDPRLVASVLDREAPALAVWKGRGVHDGAERIDPNTHWAGIALYPAKLIAATLAGLGEWDLQATLLRAVHSDGRPARVDVGALDAESEPLIWRPIRNADEADEATRVRLAGGGVGYGDWPSRLVHAPIELALLPRLIERNISPKAILTTTVICGIAATPAFATGWLWTGLLMAIFSGFLLGLGLRLGQAIDATVETASWQDRVIPAVEGSWYVGMAASFVGNHEPVAPWALAALILAGVWGNSAIRTTHRLINGRSFDDIGTIEYRIGLFGGHRFALLWSLVPFAAAGVWWAGFVWLAAYSMGTFLWSQARMLARLEAQTKGR